jgi:hypothetical protein
MLLRMACGFQRLGQRHVKLLILSSIYIALGGLPHVLQHRDLCP